jgi:hypothetical protein
MNQPLGEHHREAGAMKLLLLAIGLAVAVAANAVAIMATKRPSPPRRFIEPCDYMLGCRRAERNGGNHETAT